jgi:hypothetical protein
MKAESRKMESVMLYVLVFKDSGVKGHDEELLPDMGFAKASLP